MGKEINIYKRYLSSAKKLIYKLEKKYSIKAVFLTGSYFSRKIHKDSDLDVFIVTTNSKYREKGIFIIEGVRISYFLNPINKVIFLLKSERKSIKRPTGEMIYFSECIYDRLKKINLNKVAEKTINSSLPKMKKKQKIYEGWKLFEKTQNLDFLIKQDEGYRIHDIINYMLELSFKIHLQYMPNSKQLMKKLREIDPFLYNHFRRLFSMKNKDIKSLIKIRDYLLRKLEFNSEEYSLKSLIK